MLRKIDHKKMGSSDQGWLNSIFHFSFADYYKPTNLKYGVLRVINDDLIQPGTGFDTHPHKNMEIISYVIQGELTHADSMGNKSALTRGEVQYMSAGTGVYHSEHNFGNEVTRILQIWIYPDKLGYEPNYGEYRFKWEDRKNQWLSIASNVNGNAPVKIHQDVNLSVLELEAGLSMEYDVKQNRQAYLVLIEGDSEINQINLAKQDALEIVEEKIIIKANTLSHYLIIEMSKC